MKQTQTQLMKTGIQTTVDKLVGLIKEYHQISVTDAAKKLALPTSTIEEWAKLLEEEHVIGVEYKLGKTLLVTKELSDDEKKKRIGDFEQNKTLFYRKLEAADSYFNELDKKVQSVMSLFGQLESHMEKKLDSINTDIAQINQAQQKKEQLDKQILDSKQSAMIRLREVESHIKDLKLSYDQSFTAAKKELVTDQELLTKSEGFLHKIKQQEELLQQRLKEVQELSKTITTEVQRRQQDLQTTEHHISEVKRRHEQIRSQLETEHKNLSDLIKKNQDQEVIVQTLQEQLFAKMKATEDSLTKKERELKDVPGKFRELFSKKKEIHDILAVISHEEIELRSHIETLKRQSKLISISISPTEFEKELVRLHKQIDDINEKRNFFKEKIEQVTKLMSWS
jgi:chromosome segregation ATPase